MGLLPGLDNDVLIGIIVNITSTVGIVLSNKYIYNELNFRYMITLSMLHFAFTGFCCRLLLFAGVFEYKATTFKKILPVCIGSLGSVAFMNLNLAHNSVGFYQISKLSCIPVTLALQYYAYGTSQSMRIKSSLCIILIGVAFATVTDVELNFVGSMFAIVAVLFTTGSQIFTNRSQKLLQMNHMQLLYHTSPVITVGMLLLMPMFDNCDFLTLLGFHRSDGSTNIAITDVTTDHDIPLWAFPVTRRLAMYIFATCAMAVGVNVSNYMVLGRTSPITYQVVGHFKTITILVLGFIVFKYQTRAANVFGICVAMGGLILYGEVKRREGLASAAAAGGGGSEKDVELAEQEEKLLNGKDVGGKSDGITTSGSS